MNNFIIKLWKWLNHKSLWQTFQAVNLGPNCLYFKDQTHMGAGGRTTETKYLKPAFSNVVTIVYNSPKWPPVINDFREHLLSDATGFDSFNSSEMFCLTTFSCKIHISISVCFWFLIWSVCLSPSHLPPVLVILINFFSMQYYFCIVLIYFITFRMRRSKTAICEPSHSYIPLFLLSKKLFSNNCWIVCYKQL